MKYALLSVFNKKGIAEFAKALVDLGYTILSSGGTADEIRKAGVPVTDVKDYTGLPIMLHHKVATIHPAVAAGFLADMADAEEAKEMADNGWNRLDMAVVDCYPFKQTVADPDVTMEKATAKIDIGGPLMLREAAKGSRIVICDFDDRQLVINWLTAGEPDKDEFILNLRAKAEGYVADYCLAIAGYLSKGDITGIIGTKAYKCSYGEAKYQEAYLYGSGSNDPLAITNYTRLEGTDPSYVNLTDLDAAQEYLGRMADALALTKLSAYEAVAVKHGNACGAAFHPESPADVLMAMIMGDRSAIMGGTIACNFPIEQPEAEILVNWHNLGEDKRRLIDQIAAPDISDDAIEILRRYAGKCRLMVNPALADPTLLHMNPTPILKPVRGGFVGESPFRLIADLLNPDWLRAGPAPNLDTLRDLYFAWSIASWTVSNTVCLVRDGMLLADAGGQQIRSGAVKLVLSKCLDNEHDTEGTVVCSDSFFPKPDGPELLVYADVKAVLTTSGAKQDEQIFKIFDDAGITVIAPPDDLARMFCRH
jgi:phosphoribosylaminoimidazolecarboxamide formyltransferase/IMP cyclohydrolase